ncbi:DUF805 domain-containing protein [Rhizobium tumorigenes]|uniref:DUF805 domain-containing protein n=1 Tax=Rhizobium tumorigenes TaxID=2041385 RepID=A0AAF1K4H0_9HYPH|nr:DUF805 domain-containing protein [Rhizobium tumorigenes]WFR95713.1 DUF805 domain-containing protein [Rhizobium tumorigenes]
MEAYIDAMRSYSTFTGRATRSQYWLCALFVLGLLVVALALDKVLGLAFSPGSGGLLVVVVYLVHFMPLLAVSVRRLHDIDRTGWWVLIGPVPLAGLLLLVFACIRSTAGTNRFGPPHAPQQAKLPPSPLMALTRSDGPAFNQLNTIEQLERLATLRASGATDEPEYQKLKSSVLN